MCPRSQNHGAVEAGTHGGDESKTCTWRRSLGAGCSGLCPTGFWIYARMEAPQPLWVTHSKVWLPSPGWGGHSYIHVFKFMSIAFHPITGREQPWPQRPWWRSSGPWKSSRLLRMALASFLLYFTHSTYVIHCFLQTVLVRLVTLDGPCCQY